MSKDLHLPEAYRILPATVPLVIPGYEEVRPRSMTLAPGAVDTREWFQDFSRRIERAADQREWLPVCRLSDGEFIALVGRPPPSCRHALGKRLLLLLRFAVRTVREGGALHAATRPGVSSGSYSRRELGQLREQLSASYAAIAREGLLAVHLSYSYHPFVERFFPRIGKWLALQNVVLSFENYIPFYFVYAFLSLHLDAVVQGRTVGVIHSADGLRRERIIARLIEAGARDVIWHGISPDKSAFDRVDIASLAGSHVILLGAGVGKANIFSQLAGYPGPCIDAGFMFETWADQSVADERPYCSP